MNITKYFFILSAMPVSLEIGLAPGCMAAQLRRFLELPDAERKAIGWRGRQLAAERFAWARIAADMRAVYEWVLRRRERPQVVSLA